MSSNNDTNKKLLFNNIEEYQAEVERLEEIIKNQSQIIKKLSESKTGLRKAEILPIITGARSYSKTMPMLHLRDNPTMFFELGLDETFEKRMESVIAGCKGLGKTNATLSSGIDSISRYIDYKGETPIKELLLKQSKGQFLTKEEKDRCIKHAEKTRKNRKK